MKTTLLFIGDEDGLRDFKAMPDGRTSNARPDANFGRQVKLRRAQLDITQAELADLVGVHQVTLSRIETGTSPLTDKMRECIETALRTLEES